MKKAAHGGMNRPFIEWKRKKLWRYNNASSLSTLRNIYKPYAVVCQAFFKLKIRVKLTRFNSEDICGVSPDLGLKGRIVFNYFG